MANTVPATPTLPDPNAFAPGVVIRAGALEFVLECNNATTARAGSGYLWQQGWPDGLAARLSSTLADVTEPLLVCLPTSEHTTAKVRVVASGNGGRVDVVSTNGADTATINVASVGAELTAAVELELAADITGVETLVMRLAGTGAVEVVVYQIIVEFDELASPLPAGGVDDAVAFGLGAAVDPDRPLPARRGAELRATLLAHQFVPRSLGAWTALLSSATTGNGVDQLPAHGVEFYNPRHGLPVGDTTTNFAARVEGGNGANLYCDSPDNCIEVADSAALGFERIADTRDTDDGRYESADGRVVMLPSRLLDAATGLPPDPADVIVTSFSSWGP